MTGLCLQELTLDQKLGQVIMARGCKGPEDKAFLLEMIRNRAVGGVQIPFTDDYLDFIKEVRASKAGSADGQDSQ